MSYFLQNHKPQPELVDENLRTDYMKIRHIITEGHRINGNYHLLERIISHFGARAVVKNSFQAAELSAPENFISSLFYHGLLAIKGECFGLMELTIPNLSAFLAICDMAYDHYIVHHEQEMGRGFTDIAFEPQLNRWPHIGHAALIELKYLKQEADASPAALDQIRADAIAQLDRYAADHDLAKKWNLATQGGTVTLHRIVLVFHGGDIALCEEV